MARRLTSRRVAIAAGGLAGLVVLAAAFPGIENVPADGSVVHASGESGDTREAPPDDRFLVRIPSPEPGGDPLVYDKEHRWFTAKCAELFPRAAVRIVPADYVETPAGLVPAGVRRRPPIWR